MNRGQILYRAAEMLDGRRRQFIAELGGGKRAGREVDAAVEAFVWYAGWTDKLSQVAGTVNPVAGPYFNFTIPEPTGVVGVVAPESPALSGLVLRIAPALAGGNTVVALASEGSPLMRPAWQLCGPERPPRDCRSTVCQPRVFHWCHRPAGARH